MACHRLRLFVAISSELSEAGFRRRRMQRNTWIRWAHNSSISDALEYRFFVRHDAAAQTAAHEEDLVRLQLPSASSSRLPLWTLEMLQTAWALEHDFDFAFILSNWFFLRILLLRFLMVSKLTLRNLARPMILLLDLRFPPQDFCLMSLAGFFPFFLW